MMEHRGMHVAIRRRFLAGCLGLALLVPACSRPPQMLASPEVTSEGVVFRLWAPGASTVQLAGSWMTNARLRGLDWEAGTRIGLLQPSEEPGIWEITVPLTTGRYEYLFLIDGRFWQLDSANPQRAEDGTGGQVNLLVVR